MTTPTREQVIEWAKEIGFMRYQVELTPLEVTIESWAGSSDDLTQLARLAMSAGREQGLREAKEALSVSEHMHARNGGLMLCISDLSAVIVRMAAGIDHLSETARRWEPDHSSGADRRGWVLATEARDHALRLLKEHAAAIEQLRGK